jgi:hypothetical protein
LSELITHAWVQAWVLVSPAQFGGTEDERTGEWTLNPKGLSGEELRTRIRQAAIGVWVNDLHTDDELEIDSDATVSIAYDEG